MDLLVVSVKMDILENHMNGMDLIGLVNSALMGHAHVKKIIVARIVMIVYKVSMDFTVSMVKKYPCFVLVITAN